MKIEINETANFGGEYNRCFICDDDGDNSILRLLKNSEKFICNRCLEKYENYKEFIKKVETKAN